MSTPVYFLTMAFVLGTVLTVFGMRYFAALQQAKAKLAHDDAYRRIAETAGTAQAETAATLLAIQSGLAEVRARLAAIEKILKDVE
jgi:Tfp pilus assembly protein PilO